MFYERTARRTPQEIRADVEAVLHRHGFILVNVHDLHEMYIRAGHHVAGELFVFEISNPDLGKDAVKALPQCTVFMPYRISLYVRDGRTRLATLLPTKVAKVLPTPPAMRRSKAGSDYERRLKAVLRELCGK
ncbi:MAG TPA: DUF302 domain-containing protein [Planctomycetota bacterium]|nr:DUF302 domain-containing protein [Planctomycetota bacterium]